MWGLDWPASHAVEMEGATCVGPRLACVSHSGRDEGGGAGHVVLMWDEPRHLAP